MPAQDKPRGINSLTYEELLHLEEEWENNEGLDDRQIWLEEGAELFAKLLQIRPDEERFKISLANIYLELGRDEKVKYMNYERARRIFQEVSRLHPANPRSYYHLSFLYKNKRDWEKAIFYGEKSLDKGIAGARKIKLYCNLSLCYARLGYDDESRQYLEWAREEDRNRDYENATLIEFTMQELANESQKPFRLIRSDGYLTQLTRRELEGWRDWALEDQTLFIDLTEDHKMMSGPSDAKRLELKEAQVVEYLILQQRPCSSEEIRIHVWDRDHDNKQVVKRYIATIREAIKVCTGNPDPKRDILVTEGSAYYWKDKHTYLLQRI